MKNNFRQHRHSLLIFAILFFYSFPVWGMDDPIYEPCNEPYNKQDYIYVYYHRPVVQKPAITDYNPAWIEVTQKQEFYFTITITKKSKAKDIIQAFMDEMQSRRSDSDFNPEPLTDWFNQEMNKQRATIITRNKLYPFPIKRLLNETATSNDPLVFVLVDRDKLVGMEMEECWDKVKNVGKKATQYLCQYCCSDTIKKKLPSQWLYWSAQLQKLWSKIACCKSKAKSDDGDLLSNEDPITTYLENILVDYEEKVQKGREYYICTIGEDQLTTKYGNTPPATLYVKQLPTYHKQSVNLSSYKTSFGGLLGSFG